MPLCNSCDYRTGTLRVLHRFGAPMFLKSHRLRRNFNTQNASVAPDSACLTTVDCVPAQDYSGLAFGESRPGTLGLGVA